MTLDVAPRMATRQASREVLSYEGVIHYESNRLCDARAAFDAALLRALWIIIRTPITAALPSAENGYRSLLASGLSLLLGELCVERRSNRREISGTRMA